MKTKTRLILQFSLLFASLLLAVMGTIYLLVSKEIDRSFHKRLEDRAYIVGHNYLARDNFSKEEYQEVLHKFPRTLPTEQIRIYDTNYNSMFIEEKGISWDKGTIDHIIAQKTVFFERDNVPSVGILYEDNSGDFIIIASAQNIYGEQSLQELRYAMIISFILAIILTILLGRVFANWILSAIRDVIVHMKRIEANNLHERLPLRGIRNDEIEQLKETINQVFSRLQQAFEMQQSFVSNASHELKTPIAVLLGNAEITLRQERSTEEYKEALTNIVRDCQKMDNLIHNLLALAQVDYQMANVKQFAFEDFFWDMMDDLLQQHPSIKVAIHLQVEENLDTIRLHGNPELLKIAITNLIHNAAKFSNFQEIPITIYVKENNLFIAIDDKGIGISKEDLPKILTPFYRGKNAIGHIGSGLGLSLSEKIIHLHKGVLSITSQIDQGTNMTIKLPYTKKQIKKF